MALRDKDRITLGYAAAIALSAAAHVIFLYLVLFVLPRWLEPDRTPPPAYTVAIVDNLPAGNLGTHLPPLAGHHRQHEKPPPASEKATERRPPDQSHAAKIEAPNSDRNAIALNSTRPTEIATAEPTPTPTPLAVETPEPTLAPTQAPTPAPTAIATHRPRPTVRPRPTPRPRAEAHKLKHPKPLRPNVKPSVMVAFRTTPAPRAARTPSVKERLAMLRKQLMEEHLKELAHSKPPPEPDNGAEDNTGEEPQPATNGERPSGGGPVAANSVTNGHGYGVGPGSGSAGILKDPEFLLYYQKVQERIKDAWTFAGGRKDLTTIVNFAIAPDGKLTGLEIAQSSNNTSFDQSVLRAIRRAAPFPPPPEHYRDQFSQGVQAEFELGELRS